MDPNSPLIADAAAMNASAYASTIESMPVIPGWECQSLVFDSASGTTVARWMAQSGHVYLAVRGSASVRDVQESLKVFLGHEPASRMAFLERYIEQTCQQELSEGRLAVGGIRWEGWWHCLRPRDGTFRPSFKMLPVG